MAEPDANKHRTDKTALSYWFPKLEAAGLPVPRTKILTMPPGARDDMFAMMDGKEGPGGIVGFVAEIAEAARDFGFPFFLRTDHTSGKHSWRETCFVPDTESIGQHVWNIVEFSEICDFLGLPWNVWAVREFLPSLCFGSCPHYGDMPIAREFRFFVEDGEIRCFHPYWPRQALINGGADGFDYEALCRVDNEAELRALACAAGRTVGGAWSIDLLQTTRGWFVTDMAEAHRSFHWEGCPEIFAKIAAE